MKPEIFKQYDIRGIYPSEINENDSAVIAYETAEVLSARNCFVSFDSRRGSKSIANAIATTLASAGLRVCISGLASTPEFYFSVAQQKFDMGIMVTASHNPKQYNGLKIVKKGAVPVTLDEEMATVKERCLDYYELRLPTGKGEIENKSFRKEFVEYSLNSGYVDVSKLAKRLKIVVDLSSGAMGPAALEFFRRLPLDVIFMNSEPNPDFPSHSPNPMEEGSCNLLSKRVVSEGADLGIIFDGDGDRVLFLDESGRIVRGDIITAIVGEDICSSKPRQKILYDLRSSIFVPETIRAAGGIPIMCRIGHSLIKRQMREERAAFAGELSGHYYYPMFNSYFENSLITCLQLIKIVCEKGKLSILAGRNKYFQSGELNFEVAEKERILKEVERVFEKEKKGESHLDGLFMEFGSWRFSLRASNTEPLLRLNIEADSEALLNEKKEVLNRIISQFSQRLIGARKNSNS
ncbi:MAG: phosphomannomutase/phosphoglucomutase [Candidatus Woesearchaeota archaeon]